MSGLAKWITRRCDAGSGLPFCHPIKSLPADDFPDYIRQPEDSPSGRRIDLLVSGTRAMNVHDRAGQPPGKEKT